MVAKRTTLFLGFALALLVLSGCAVRRMVLTNAQNRLPMDQFVEDIIVLSSDEFEGRSPGTPGGIKAVTYIERRFKELGLEPGNGDSYRQEVPLMRVGIDTNSSMVVQSNGVKQNLRFGYDFTASYTPIIPEVALENSDLVFIGYGAVDPEYSWDDYSGIDVEGKIVIILWNDPGFMSGDTSFFMGKENTRSASTRTKYREATEHGAAGALVIVDTTLSTPRTTFEGLSRSLLRSRVSLQPDEPDTSLSTFTGYLNLDAARSLLAQAGYSYDSVLVAATKREFEPFSLGLSSITMLKRIDYFTSYNVMGLSPGSRHPDEFVIYTAHWDHLGMDTTREGDQIFNGAADNAAGVASIIAVGDILNGLDKRPRRSVLFIALTAEESGLLGSRYYAENPVFPLTRTTAVFNVDMPLPFGKSRDVVIIGSGQSELDDYVAQAAEHLDLYAQPDPWPERNYYYRSDQVNFARQGVPAIFLWPGVDNVAVGQDSILSRFDQFMGETYHSPEDEYKDSWDLAGIEDYLKVLVDVGYTVSNKSRFPEWSEDSEFKAIREAAMIETRN